MKIVGKDFRDCLKRLTCTADLTVRLSAHVEAPNPSPSLGEGSHCKGMILLQRSRLEETRSLPMQELLPLTKGKAG
jgi:hypothetical protein